MNLARSAIMPTLTIRPRCRTALSQTRPKRADEREERDGARVRLITKGGYDLLHNGLAKGPCGRSNWSRLRHHRTKTAALQQTRIRNNGRHERAFCGKGRHIQLTIQVGANRRLRPCRAPRTTLTAFDEASLRPRGDAIFRFARKRPRMTGPLSFTSCVSVNDDARGERFLRP